MVKFTQSIFMTLKLKFTGMNRMMTKKNKIREMRERRQINKQIEKMRRN